MWRNYSRHILYGIGAFGGSLLQQSMLLWIFYYYAPPADQGLPARVAPSLLGIAMKRLGWPRPPVIVGIVLQRLAETYFFLTTKLYGASWVTRPIVILLFCLAVASVAHAVLAGLPPSWLRYVEVEPLKSRAGMLSQLNVLSAPLGTLPATALDGSTVKASRPAEAASNFVGTTPLRISNPSCGPLPVISILFPGSAGAELGVRVVLILGIANLIGDGFSMAASNYSGTRAEHQQLEQAVAIERRHIEQEPEGERSEIREIFRRKGLDGDELVIGTLLEGLRQRGDEWRMMVLPDHPTPVALKSPRAPQPEFSDDPHETFGNLDAFLRREAYAAAVTTEWRGEAFDVTSITAFQAEWAREVRPRIADPIVRRIDNRMQDVDALAGYVAESGQGVARVRVAGARRVPDGPLPLQCREEADLGLVDVERAVFDQPPFHVIDRLAHRGPEVAELAGRRHPDPGEDAAEQKQEADQCRGGGQRRRRPFPPEPCGRPGQDPGEEHGHDERNERHPDLAGHPQGRGQGRRDHQQPPAVRGQPVDGGVDAGVVPAGLIHRRRLVPAAGHERPAAARQIPWAAIPSGW